MRFMIIVKMPEDVEEGVVPEDSLLKEIADYHGELAKAGVLLDASRLEPTSAGWRIQYDGETRRVVDGSFTRAKEVIAGYMLIQAKTREEALEWTRRFPNPAGRGRKAEIEVRPLFERESGGVPPLAIGR